MPGLGRKVFTPGEVLTATNVQNYLMDQAVQVYAGTAARGSAIGSATTEGMVSYLADVDALQVATGTATWISLKPGLVPLVPTSVVIASGSATTNVNGTVSFTGVSSFSLNGVFSSTYTNYKIVADFSGSSASTTLQLRFRKAGTDYSGAQYNFGGLGMRTGGTTSSFSGVNATSFNLAWINGPAAGSGSTAGSVDVFNPFGASFQKIVSTMLGTDSTSMAGIYVGGNCFSSQTANDGFTLQAISGTFSGTVQVYGYTN
jgi:hypothetical protein